MGFEETAMGAEGLRDRVAQYAEVGFKAISYEGILKLALYIAQDQAEITWKARDDEVKIAMEQGKAEGLKEVVEWVTENTYKPMHYPGHLGFSAERWQAFLKEKGL